LKMDKDPIYHPNPIHILTLSIPETEEVIYENTFYIEDETKEEFKKITDSRRGVVVASSRSYAEAAIKGVQKYLPALFGLIKGVDKLPPDFTKYYKTFWTSSLSYYNEKKYKHTSFYFEVVSVLTVYGLLHRKIAMEKLTEITEENFDESCTVPLKYLREASGIFEYISQQVSTKFVVAPNILPIPEIFSESFNLLSSICLAEGQEFIVRKAIVKK